MLHYRGLASIGTYSTKIWMSTELAENRDLGPLGHPHHCGVHGFCRIFITNLKFAQGLRGAGRARERRRGLTKTYGECMQLLRSYMRGEVRCPSVSISIVVHFLLSFAPSQKAKLPFRDLNSLSSAKFSLPSMFGAQSLPSPPPPPPPTLLTMRLIRYFGTTAAFLVLSLSI